MVRLSDYDKTPIVVEGDTLHVRFDTLSGILRLGIGSDSMLFDLRELAVRLAGDSDVGVPVPAERFQVEASGSKRKGKLALESLNGRRSGSSVKVERWQGRLFLGAR
jgi:hypothetical protein